MVSSARATHRLRSALGPVLVVPLLTAVPAAAVLADTGPAPVPVVRSVKAPGTGGALGATAPDSSAPGDPSAPGRIRRGQVGFSPGFGILDGRPAVQRRQLARMRALGVRRIRLDVGWARVQQSPTNFDWSDTDRVVKAARAARLKVLGVISYEPSWARTADASGGASAVDPADFAAFAARAAARYRGLVADWELWNEPNLDWSWGADPDPAAYARLVEAAAPAIRDAAPRARVVVGALAPAVDAEDGSQVAPETFLSGFYAAISSPDLFDAVSVHPYSYPAMPDGDEDWNTFHKLPELHDIMAGAGDASTPIWLTEYGAPTGTSDRAVTARQQADMVVTALREAGRLDFVGPVFLYSFRDARRDLVDPEANFGVTRYGGRPKAAYWALRRVLR